MDMLRERQQADQALTHLREQIERAAIACSHGNTQIARDILLEALEQSRKTKKTSGQDHANPGR